MKNLWKTSTKKAKTKTTTTAAVAAIASVLTHSVRMQKINQVRDETPRPLRRITTARSRVLSSGFLQYRRRFCLLLSHTISVFSVRSHFFRVLFMCWRWRMVWYSIKLSIIILFSLSSLKMLCVLLCVVRCSHERLSLCSIEQFSGGWLGVRAATLPFHMVQLSAFGIYILGITLKSFLPTHRYYY